MERLVGHSNGRGGTTNYTMLPNGLLKTEAFDNGTLKYTKTYGYNAANGIQLNTLRRDQTVPSVTHSLRRFFYTHGNIACVAHDILDASGTTTTAATKNDCSNAAGST